MRIDLIRLLVLASASLAQSATPVPAPGTTTDFNLTVPSGSPWWVAILVGAAGLIFWMIRSYVDSRLRKDRAEFDARIEKERAEFDLKMEQLRGQREDEQSDTRKTEALAKSINAMAESITRAYSDLAKDRQDASAERREFRTVLDDNTKELKQHAEELGRLRELIDSLVRNTGEVRELAALIQARIGGSRDDPPLTKLISEATEAAKQAAQTIRQLEENAKQGTRAPAADGSAQEDGNSDK